MTIAAKAVSPSGSRPLAMYRSKSCRSANPATAPISKRVSSCRTTDPVVACAMPGCSLDLVVPGAGAPDVDH